MIYDVIVVGAGVVGALTARELARYDLKVLVLDAGDDAATGATKANSAIVHGGFAEGPDTLKGRLCIQGRRAFARLEEELQFGYRVTGSLVVSFESDPSRLHALYERGRSNGLTDLELWSAAKTRAHEPRLNPRVAGALWCAGAGVCSPWDLAYAALENAVAHGVEIRLGQNVVAVEGPSKGGEARWTLSTSNASYQTRWVVNAAGLGGGQLDALAGLHDTTITPRTGEYLVFAPGTGSLVNSVIFQLPGPMGKGVLVGPTYQNNLLVGPDARNENLGEALGSTHAERLAALVAQASAVVDGIDLKQAIRSFTGIRAAAPSGDFVVGPAPVGTHPGWHRAVGIQSPGLTASPALARLLVDGLASAGLRLAHRPGFDPSRRPLSSHLSRRPERLPFPEADALTRLPLGDPERMVCRCEQVRERDLAEACSRGLPVTTVDALKRRTRAGMGWCQGRFCRPRVAQWLVDKLGVPVPPESDAQRSGLHRVEGRDLWKLADQSD